MSERTYQVIVFPRGQLSPEDKLSMRDVGIIAVEADDPKSVVVVVPGAPLAGAGDLFLSALHGCTYMDGAMSKFGTELRRRLLEREKAATERPAATQPAASEGQ